MECCSHSTSNLDSRSQTSHPQWCHWLSLHSFPLQQLSTTTPEPTRRNIIWSLTDHIKWHFQKRCHTRRWRLWRWKQEHKDPHSCQKSTMDMPCFYKWKSVFPPYHTTHHSWTTRTHPTNIQKLQPCMPLFSVYQLWWWEPCTDWWSIFMTLQYTRWQPTPGKRRITFTTSSPHGLLPYIYTMNRWLLPEYYNRRRRFSHSSTRWWRLVRRTSSR